MKDLLQTRKFINTNEDPSSSDYILFSICSYNILAQYQLKNNLYLYTHCDAHVLEWSVRWNNIRNDLERMNCDIYCLQEVQGDHYYADIEPAMEKMGYKGYLSAKTGHKQDGCAIFVKRTVFDCELSTFETVQFHRDDVRVLSTDNVGQVALLCPVGRPQTKMCLANTHLFFNPNRGDVKLAELSVLLARIDSVARSHRSEDRCSAQFYWPIVMCADLNSGPDSALLRLVTEGRLDVTHVLASAVSGQNETSFGRKRTADVLSAADLPPRVGISDRMVLEEAPGGVGSGLLTHDLRLRSACDYGGSTGARLVSASTRVDSCAVDFVLYRAVPGPTPYLQLTSHLQLVTPQQMEEVGGIPNELHGSDHIPMVAKFRLHL